ncbi:MAG: hypothetical protein B6I31_02130 [Desulfobacteraceae bacterium 4572_19]|nr:MAG: hypothetical protein B6I31_02130 [Desulfobacteraceae bacterium 4572_19]
MNEFLKSLHLNKDRRQVSGRRNYDDSQESQLAYHYNNELSQGNSNRFGNNHENEKNRGYNHQKEYGYQKDYQHKGRKDYKNQHQPSALSNDTVESLIHSIYEMIGNQKNQIFLQEQNILTEERKAIALENIAGCLQYLVSENISYEADHTNGTKESVSITPNEKRAYKSDVVSPQFSETKNREQDKEKFTQMKNIIENQKKEQKSSITPDLRNEIMDVINTMRVKKATYDEIAKYLVSLNLPTFSGRGEWHAQTIHRLCKKKSVNTSI